jgi:hypothetical protein
LVCCRRSSHDGALLEIGLGIGFLESLGFTPFLLGQALKLGHRALAKTVVLAGGVTRQLGSVHHLLRFRLDYAQPYGLCRHGVEIGL